MLDLEHLDALDDDAPPEPDLGQARARAVRMRTHRRLTAIAVGVAVLAGAVAVVAVVRDDNDKLKVAGPTAATSVPTTPQTPAVTSGTLPNGLPVTLTVAEPTVALGSDIRATVVVRNDTSTMKGIGPDPIVCAVNVRPVLRDAAGAIAAFESSGGACRTPLVALAPGASKSFAIALDTDSLAPGAYDLLLENVVTAGPQPTWALPPVRVKVVAPEGLTARLELPQTTYPSGYSLEGTTVFVNGTGRAIEYELGCSPWEVVLSQDGLRLTPELSFNCGAGLPTQRIPPGVTRVPFYVVLGYAGCGASGEATPAMPRCSGDPPGTPDLPPGHYQIAFRGTDAPFDSIDVTPVDIEVVRRPQVTDGLPRITSATVKGAQLEFQRLYLASDAPYRSALINRHITPLLTATMGDRLLVTIADAPNAHQAKTILLSLFDHPELVTIETGDPNEVGRQ